MAATKHTEAQMVEALKQLEVGRRAKDVALELGVSEHTIDVWSKTFKLTKKRPQADPLCCSHCGSHNIVVDRVTDTLVCVDCAPSK